MTIELNEEKFKDKIFDYSPLEETPRKEGDKEERNNLKWKFAGDKPAIIDFYANWCGPCKMVAPILEELSDEYEGQVDIYKVNTEEEPYLASMFGIRSIPSMLFIPMGDDATPQMQVGAMGKAELKEAITDKLL